MRPWTSYCLSLSSGLEEIICALGNICHSETSDKESLSRFAKFYKIDGEVLEAEQKMYASFRCVRGLGHMTVSEMQKAIQERFYLIRFQSSPEKMVHILAVKPARSCSAERSFSALRRLKLTSAAPWSNNVSVTSHLLTLKEHMPTLQSTMTYIIPLVKIGKDRYVF